MAQYNPNWVIQKFPNNPKEQRDYLMYQFGYVIDRENDEMWQLRKPKKFNIIAFLFFNLLYLIYYGCSADNFIIINKNQTTLSKLHISQKINLSDVRINYNYLLISGVLLFIIGFIIAAKTDFGGFIIMLGAFIIMLSIPLVIHQKIKAKSQKASN